MEITRQLRELLGRSGLTDEEVRFYLAVLKKPNSTIYDLSKTAKIAKDRAYQICESLEDKKLIGIEKDGQLKKLSAKSLKSFVEKLKSEGRRLHRTADSLKDLNPFLHLMGGTEEDCVFRTFGHDEAGEAFVDISLRKGWDNVLAYGALEDLIPVIGADSDRKFVRNRTKLGKKCFPVLANPGDYSWNEVIRFDDKELRKTKIWYSEKASNYLVTLLPETNTTGIWIKDENGIVKGVLIESPLVAQLHENIFKHFDEVSEEASFRKIEKKGE